MPRLKSSATRLRERLASHGDARQMLLTEAQYHAQVQYTCQLLDIVDEEADQATAERITDAICERLACDRYEAHRRVRDTQAEYERIVSERMPRTYGQPL
jgi:phage baseplate assembly protein W